MRLKRLWWMVRIATIRGGSKRTIYAKKHHIYGEIGNNVFIQSRYIPIYSELIKFHNNIVIAKNVDFCTHDVIHQVLNRVHGEYKFHERIGCIEIMDNVFVGSNSTILYDTRIGPNVVIASGSVVTGDCLPDSVYAGCPARRVGSFQEFLEKRKTQQENGKISITTHNQNLTDDEIQRARECFESLHSL